MPGRSNEEIVHAYLAALADPVPDWDLLATFRDPDWRLDYPQSGERIRGHANDVAINEHYPGGLPRVDPGRIVGSEDRWVVTPSLTVARIVGSGEVWWSEGIVRYPDGPSWHVASMYQLRNGKVVRETAYWAEPFDPPAWRAEWVEPINRV
jgi:hypothetical protein